MAVSTFVYEVIQEQLNNVVALTDPRVVETAMKLSFYVAMVDAANDDPMDDEIEQQEMLAFLSSHIKELTEKYQQLVNELI